MSAPEDDPADDVQATKEEWEIYEKAIPVPMSEDRIQEIVNFAVGRRPARTLGQAVEDHSRAMRVIADFLLESGRELLTAETKAAAILARLGEAGLLLRREETE